MEKPAFCKDCSVNTASQDLVYRLGHEITGGNARVQGLNNLLRIKLNQMKREIDASAFSKTEKLVIKQKLEELYNLSVIQLTEIVKLNLISTKIILNMDGPLKKTALFNFAVTEVLQHEGGYNDIKEDHGGATNWGISLRFLEANGIDIDGDGDVDWQDVAALEREKAIEIYHTFFWKNEYDHIGGDMAVKLFDTAVNMGNSRAHKILQRSCNTFGHNLLEDGIIGSKTLNVILQIDKIRLMDKFCMEQAKYYVSIVHRDPSQLKFAKGWMRRASYIPNSTNITGISV